MDIYLKESVMMSSVFVNVGVKVILTLRHFTAQLQQVLQYKMLWAETSSHSEMRGENTDQAGSQSGSVSSSTHTEAQ